MKYIIGFAAFVLLSCVPAYAQRPAAGSGGGTGAGVGGGYGGSLGGSTSRLPNYPATNFQASYVTRADNYNYSPSTFRSYDQAVKEGRDVLAEHAKTIVEIAKETRDAERQKAKLAIEQDAIGRPIIETR